MAVRTRPERWPTRVLAAAVTICVLASTASAQPVLNGSDDNGDWHADAPGVRRHITQDIMPPPFASSNASRGPEVVVQPRHAVPDVPAGFEASLFATDLDRPRTLRAAPNGDVSLAESGAGASRVFAGQQNRGQQNRVFAANLTLPFGIGFWLPGPSPCYVYVAETNRVVRFSFPGGGSPEVIVPTLPGGGHWTRDLVFSANCRSEQ